MLVSGQRNDVLPAFFAHAGGNSAYISATRLGVSRDLGGSGLRRCLQNQRTPRRSSPDLPAAGYRCLSVGLIYLPKLCSHLVPFESCLQSKSDPRNQHERHEKSLCFGHFV